MRILFFLYLILNIAGTLLPCCVDEGCCEEETSCSASSICASCHSSAEITEPAELIHQPKTPAEIYIYGGTVNIPSNAASECWQPPRHMRI